MSKKEKRFLVDVIDQRRGSLSFAPFFLSKVFLKRKFGPEYHRLFHEYINVPELIQKAKESKIDLNNKSKRSVEEFFLLLDSSVLDKIENKSELKVSLGENLDIHIDTGIFKFRISKDDIGKIDTDSFLYRRIINIDENERWGKYEECVIDHKDKYKIMTLNFEDIEKIILLSFSIDNPNKKTYLFISNIIKKLKLSLYHNFNIKLFVEFKKSDLHKYIDVFSNIMLEKSNLDSGKHEIACEIFSNGFFRVIEYLNFGKIYLISEIGYDLGSTFDISEIELTMSQFEKHKIKNDKAENSLIRNHVFKFLNVRSWVFAKHHDRSSSVNLSIDDFI